MVVFRSVLKALYHPVLRAKLQVASSASQVPPNAVSESSWFWCDAPSGDDDETILRVMKHGYFFAI